MNESAVVSAEWLAKRLDEVALVDVREAWEYESIGHLPGAVNVPFESFRSDEHAAVRDSDEERSHEGEAGMLPGSETFARLLGEAGISNDVDIVAYDDTHGGYAARLLVTCLLYGHPGEKLHLLDGDYSAWSRDRAVSRETPAVEPTTYEARFTPGPLVDADEVQTAIDDRETVIVDTRAEWEYEDGHVPGAVRLDWIELVDRDSRYLRPDGELRDLLESRGVTPDRRILLYCNTARRISHTYVVLRHLGYENLAFYEGSMTEWEATNRPLA